MRVHRKTCDQLPEVIRSALPDSEIAKSIKLCETKATGVVKNVIAKSSLDELALIIKVQKFSAIIDESTDDGTVKNLAVCVRFFDERLKSIKTLFWKLVNIFSKDDPDDANEGATAE